MMWYQNSFLLDPTDRRSMQSKGDRYTLTIRNFQPSDFGNYRYYKTQFDSTVLCMFV